MKLRLVGRQGLEVGALGLGCMGMSWAYGKASKDEARRTIDRAVEVGVTMFDTADSYGPWTNEELVGEALRSVRDDVVIATKFGNVRAADGSLLRIDGSPAYLRQACDASLSRLGIDTIDLYYQHTPDPTVPIEETVGAMAELVETGKVRFLGLSNIDAEAVRRAHRVFPISAVQNEYSLWARDIEVSLLPTLRELGIGLVAYSPLGRGFLSGAIRERAALDPGDVRLDRFPRFADGNLQHNLQLLDAVEHISRRVGCTPSQVSLAWVLTQGEDVVPIPGTTKTNHLDENLVSFNIELSRNELEELDALLDQWPVRGETSSPSARHGSNHPEDGR